MYRFLQIFKRDFLNLAYNPMRIFYSAVFPIILVLIIGFLTSGNYGSSVSSYDYYGVTMLIYTIFTTSQTAANSFLEERVKRGNLRIVFSPLSEKSIYMSKIFAAVVFCSLSHLFVILFFKFALNVNFGGKNLILIILELIVFEIFASSLGVLLCCIFKNESTTNQILSLIINISALLGGVFFQLDGFGKNFERLSYVSPLKWIIIDIFRIIYDNDFSYYLPTIVILIILTIVALFLCDNFYNAEDYI